MTKIKEIIYPITVYSVGEGYNEDGELFIRIFDKPPDNYDSHQIRGDKFIWALDLEEGPRKYEYYLNKREAKKVALDFTKKRIKEYQGKVTALKKQLKEIRAI